ncbi:MAG TPA: D-glycerate dehydrogenase [Solirubrobacteraceae bacterium]|jgi:glyoxylate reductase|nr:D-glycerate dehydrogenase [Solirubrobacteraceae bacterium]
MAQIFVTRRLPGPALDRLSARHDVEIWPDRLPPPADALAEHAHNADGLLSTITDRIDAELIAACPNLKAIANYAVGYDNVDIAAATARGIPVGNTPDVLTDATADLAFTLLLAAARRLLEACATVTDGTWDTWDPRGLLGRSVNDKTLGIIGAGRIGRAVAKRASGFDMEVLLSGRPGEDDAAQPPGHTPIPELLRRSDFVSIHCPLTERTRHLIDAEALALMRPTAILVNTARGPIVDQQALARALHERTIGGAALDVTDPEPLPPDDPLLQAPNLIVAPHIGSATHEAREQMAERSVDNLLAALDGQPMPHPVNRP